MTLTISGPTEAKVGIQAFKLHQYARRPWWLPSNINETWEEAPTHGKVAQLMSVAPILPRTTKASSWHAVSDVHSLRQSTVTPFKETSTHQVSQPAKFTECPLNAGHCSGAGSTKRVQSLLS
jgi:hypothetical protein